MLPKVVFLHPNVPDYLWASVFHGLRSVLGERCVDVPRFDAMYAPLTPVLRQKANGHGFTLFGLLKELPCLRDERFFWSHDLSSIDLFVVGMKPESSSGGMAEIVDDLSRQLPAEKLVIVDGHDSPAIFPYALRILRKAPWLFFNRASWHLCFKRELHDGGSCLGLHRLSPAWRQRIPVPSRLRSIAFSIPREKVRAIPASAKTKEFGRHIVDPEVAEHVQGAVTGQGSGAHQWAFDSESAYYDDLAASRFGITTKRAGWDCLRHYELAANGCVLCFKDLDEKPPQCAPHGLDATNCLTYRNYADLRRQIDQLSEGDYARLLKGTHQWALANTTDVQAHSFLQACGLLSEQIG